MMYLFEKKNFRPSSAEVSYFTKYITKYGMKLNSHKLVAIIILFQLTVLIGLLEVVSQGWHGTGNLDVHFSRQEKNRKFTLNYLLDFVVNFQSGDIPIWDEVNSPGSIACVIAV